MYFCDESQLSRGRVMKILVKGKVETVSLDRVKPAHLDNKSAIGTKKNVKRKIIRIIRKLLRQFEGNGLSNRIPERRELNRKQKHSHGLWRFNMVRIWLLLHSIIE